MESIHPHSDPSLSFTGIPERPTDSSDGSPKKRQRSSRRRFLLSLMVLLLVVSAIFWVPKEISNWYHAAALEAHFQNNIDAAKSLLDTARRWDPNDTAIYKTRSDWKLGRKDFEGSLEDISYAVRIDPDNFDNYRARSNIYQRMGRFEDAVQDQTKLVEEFRQRGDDAGLHHALNNRAYFRALGKIDLDPALEDIQEAIVLWKQYYSTESPSYLDTRGYIEYLLGEIAAAETDLTRAIELAEKEHTLITHRFSEHEETITQMNHHLAVICHHRGLVHQARGETELAEDYLQRADDLGYNPEEGIW